MVNFSFAVLGSVTFWVVYLVVSVFVTTALLKVIDKETFSFLVGGKNHKTDFQHQNRDYYRDSDDLHPYVGYVFTILIIFIFWPIVLPVTLIVFIILKTFVPALLIIRKTAIAVDKMTPTIKFGKEDKDD